jgi:phosphoribosylformylglycinamidine synthase
MSVTENLNYIKTLNIPEDEYSELLSRLGRTPNEIETYLFSAMWSEHCGYKHSRKYLSRFPKTGSVCSEENAGGVQIGNNIIFFKVESHNHPSAVEPFQGAATGIGGIIRDVLALGARPIALLDSLKFGPLTDNHVKHLFDGVVKGIAAYGIPSEFRLWPGKSALTSVTPLHLL